MQIVGIVREIKERSFTRKDGHLAQETVVTFEVGSPIALIEVSVHRDHKLLAAELAKAKGQMILLPIVGTAFSGRNGAFLKYSTADQKFSRFSAPAVTAAA